MEFGPDLRSRYPDSGRCTYLVAGLPRSPESISVRCFNFGQHWRTRGVVDVEYRVQLPPSFALDLLREQLPDYLEDSRSHPDPDSEVDRLLEAAGWPDATEVLERPDLLPFFLDFYAHDLLLHWFGDVEPERRPGFVLNTIDGIDFGPAAISIHGSAREAGMPVRYQDR